MSMRATVPAGAHKLPGLSSAAEAAQQNKLNQDKLDKMLKNFNLMTSPNLVLRDDFEIVDKNGWRFKLLCLLKPFYSLVGKDVYSHYRINHVAQSILATCDDNKVKIRADESILGSIKSGIQHLSSRAGHKHKMRLGNWIAEMENIVKPKTNLHEKIDLSRLTHKQQTIVKASFAPDAPDLIKIIASFDRMKSPNLVLRDDFEVENKNGWRFRLLCLLRPFYSLFGKDVYSHYRINNVVGAILETCRLNKERLKADPSLLQSIKSNIQHLGSKIQNQDQATLGKWAAEIEEIVKPKIVSQNGGTKIVVISKDASPAKIQRGSSEPAHEERVAPVLLPPNFKLLPIDPRKAVQNGIGTEEQIVELNTVLNEFIQIMRSQPCFLQFHKTPRPKGQPAERKLSLTNAAGQKMEKSIPLTLEVIYNENELVDIILFTKVVVGVGGQAVPRFCVSLVTGESLVKKICGNGVASNILQHFADQQNIKGPIRGIVPLYGFREVPADHTRNGVIKYQSLERRMAGSLEDAIEGSQDTPPSFEQRFKMVLDILAGIQAIHKLSSNSIVVAGREIPQFKASHRDLKPSNIVVEVDKNGFNGAYIIDFGLTDPAQIGGTMGYTPPEAIALHVELDREKSRQNWNNAIDHNVQLGQQGDIWSTALVLIALFTWDIGEILGENDEVIGSAPLHCIRDCLIKGVGQKVAESDMTRDAAMRAIRQENIDHDLETLKQLCLLKVQGQVKQMRAITELWVELKAMLRREPASRKPIAQVFASLKKKCQDIFPQKTYAQFFPEERA